LQGTTLLIVSHDKAAIQSICDRAILLSAGCILKQGLPEEIMDYYNAMLAERENATVRQQATDDGKTQTVSGSGEATVTGMALVNDAGEKVEVIDVGQAVSLQITVAVKADLPELVLGYMIKDRLGQPVFGSNTYHLRQPLKNLSAGESITFKFAFAANLGEGAYSIAVALHTSDTHIEKNYEWRDIALIFNVVNMSKGQFIGVAWLDPTLEILR